MLAFIISIDITQNKHKHGVHWNKWLNFKSFTNWDLYTVRFHSPDCGSKPSLMHGSYQGASTTFPSSATAHCDTGYDLSGNDTVTCQTSGTWSRIQATCTPVGNREFCSICTFVKFTFHALFYCAPRKNSGEHIVAALSVRPSIRQSFSLSVRQSVRPIHVRPITSLFVVGFFNYFTAMTTMLRQRVARKFWSLPWRSRSQYDLSAK